MNKQTLTVVFTMLFFSLVSFAEMGVPIQLRLKSPSGIYPTESGLSFKIFVLSPSTHCVLREEDFSSQSINNGSVSLTLGSGILGSIDPGLSLNQVYDNSKIKLGLSCVDANNNVISTGQTYTPNLNDHRTIRITTGINADTIIANFEMRSVPYAIQADSTKKIQDINVSSILPTLGQILQFNGSEYIPTTISTGSSALTNGKIFIGDAANMAVEQSLSGDATINSSGVLTLSNTTTASTVGSASSVPTIAFDAKGRITSTSSAAYQDASAISKGIVQVGSNISVTSGVISVPTANSTTTGVLNSSDWNIFNSKQNTLGFTPLNPANNLNDISSPATSRTNLGLGSSAVLDVGTSATNVVQLDGSARIPASTLPVNAITNASTFSGDISGTSSNIKVEKIQNAPVNSLTPTAGQALVFDGTQWVPAHGVPLFSKSNANQTFTTNTLTDVTSLSFAVTTGVVYRYRFHILYTSAATTTGLRLSLTYPAVTTASALAQIPSGADGTAGQTHGTINSSGDIVTATSSSAASTVHYASIQGVIIPSANGVVQLRAASEINGSNIVIQAGSFSEVNVVP